ncbi:ankyrin repeat domain-containing protein [Erysipelothrix urinaevulpis]|uniref:ankyrin repeat domain-containing protein n=1 Tax=Erysipelothrix urinaevulpis TaxID=2683717 RepID=UPI00191644D8|nr:ankyrin repeat domain-containing protein [Erysipelothrix urinaevulpis]
MSNTQNINTQNKSDALMIAVQSNDIETAKYLIDQGANVNMLDSLHDTPYLYAGAEGRLEILDYMYQNAEIDYDIRNRYGGNTLIPAAEKGHIDTVRLILDYGKEPIDLQNNFGYTALIEAVALGDGSEVYQDIVKLLIEHGADPTLQDNSQKSAIDYAEQYNYTSILESLKSQQ